MAMSQRTPVGLLLLLALDMAALSAQGAPPSARPARQG